MKNIVLKDPAQDIYEKLAPHPISSIELSSLISEVVKNRGIDSGLMSYGAVIDSAKNFSANAYIDKNAAEPIPVAPTIDIIVNSTSQFTFESDCPSELLVNIAEYIYFSSRVPSKFFSIAAALNVLSHVSRNKFYVDKTTGLNLFMVFVADTGGGKESPRTGIKNIFKAIDYMDCIDGKMTSSAALINTLAEREDHNSNLLMDEFGKTLQIGTKGGGLISGFLDDILEVYSSSRGPFLGKRYADQKKCIPSFDNPFLNILGTAETNGFFKGVTEDSITSGLLNRFLYIETDSKGVKNRNQVHEVPPDIITALNELRSIDHDNPMTYEPDAYELLIHYDNNVSRHPDYIHLWARYDENVAKIAGLISLPSTIISKESVTWAAEFVKASIDSMCSAFDNNLAFSKFEIDINKVLKIIKNAKSYNEAKFKDQTDLGLMPFSKIASVMKKPSNDLEKVTKFLCDTGKIEESKHKGIRVLKAL